MADDLRIIVGFKIDQGKEILNLNAEIEKLEKKLNSLKLKIEIDKEVLNTFSQLAKTVGTTTNSLNNDTAAINKHTDAVNKATQAEKQWQIEQEKTSRITGKKTTVYGNASDNSKQTVIGNVDGSIRDIIDKTNPQKDLQDYNKAFEKLLKEEETIDRAHYQALKDDRSRAEALDKVHYQALQENGKRYVSDLTKLLNEAEVIDRAHYNALRDNAAKSEAAEKQHYLALQQNAKRENDFLKQKSDIQTKILDAQRRFAGDKTLVSSLDNLLGSAQQITSIGNYKNAITDVDSQLKKFVTTANSAKSNSISFGESFKTAMQKFPVWMLATTAFYAPLRALESGVKTIYDIDTAMTDLQKVTDNTTKEYADFVKQAGLTGNEIGNLTTNVIKATTEWARLGYNIQQSQALAKETLVYQNVGDVKSAEEASTQLIATIKGFGIEVDDQGKNIAKIVDIYNEVGNKFAISSSGIGSAMQRSASSLKEAGNTIEQAVALTTAANSTIQDPERVGNALKTISMRLRGVSDDGSDLSNILPTLEKKFQSIGISLLKDENTFKNTYEIFGELSKVWKNLNDLQRSDVLELVAGKLQGNIAASIIQNWKDAEGALQAGLNSVGSATRENEKYLNSLQGKMAVLKNTVSNFWLSSFNSDLFKGFISAVTSLVQHLDSLGNVVMLTSGLFLLFRSRAIGNLISGAVDSVKALFTMKTAMQATAQTAEATTVAVSGTAVAMTGLQRALGVIGLVISAGSILYTIFNQVQDSTEKLNKSIDDNNKKYSENANQLQDTASYYKENFTAINSNVDVKNKLFTMQNQLIDTFGKEASGLDLVNGKYDEQIKKIDELQKKNLDNKIKDNQIAVDAINQQKYSKPSIAAGNGLDTTIGVGKQSYSVADGGGFGNLNLEQYYKQLLDAQDKIRNKNTEIFAGANLIPKSAEEWNTALSAVKEKIDKIKPLYDQVVALEDDKKQKIKNSTLEQAKFNSEQQTMFDKINDAVKSQPTKDYENSISTIVDTIKNADDKNISKAIDKIKEIPSIKGNTEIINTLDKIKNSSSSAGQASFDLSTIQNNLSKVFSDTTKNLAPLNDAIDKLKQGHELTSSEITSLIDKYPDLINGLTTENGHLQLGVTLLETKRQTEIDTVNATITKQDELISKQKEQLMTELTSIGMRIDANSNLKDVYDSLSQKQQEVSNDTDMGVSGQGFWLNQLGQMKGKIENLQKAKDAIEALKEAAKNGFSFETKNNTSSSNSFIDKIFQNLPAYKQQVDDTSNQIKSLNEQVQEVERAIQAADKENDLDKKKQLESQLNDILEERKNKYHEIADSLRSVQTEVTKNFDKSFASFRDGRNFEDIPKEDIQKFINALDKSINDVNNKIGHATSDTVKTNLQKQLQYLQDRKDLFNFFIGTFDDISKGINAKSSSWWDDFFKQLDSKDSVKKIEEDAIKAQDDAHKKWLDGVNKVADQVIEAYKAVYEAQKDAALKAIENEQNAEDKRHNDKIANIESEYKTFEDAVNKQLQLIDRQSGTEDFNSQLSKLQKEAQSIQDTRNKAVLDTSIDGRARVSDLDKQYADKQEEIQKLQNDRTKTIRKDSLQDLLDQKKKETDASKTAEDKQYQTTKDFLDKKKQATEQYWKGVIENDTLNGEIRQKIINGQLDIITTDLAGFADKVNSKMELIGRGISENLINKLKDAGDALNGIDRNTTDSHDSKSGFYISSSDAERKKINQMIEYSHLWNKFPGARAMYEEYNQKIGKDIGATYRNGTWYKNGIPLYHEGGEVGGSSSLPNWLSKGLNLKSDELVAILKKGEYVLKNPVSALTGLMNRITTPNTGAIRPAGAGGSGDTIINLDVHIDNLNGDKKGVDKFFSEVSTSLKRGLGKG